MDNKQIQCIELAEKGENIFITGSAGTGKSFTVNKIDFSLLTNGKQVSVTAMTGCAAILISPKARTLHSWGGIGLGKENVD
jgi:predicted GTPase